MQVKQLEIIKAELEYENVIIDQKYQTLQTELDIK
jgi:hypothetical protein